MTASASAKRAWRSSSSARKTRPFSLEGAGRSPARHARWASSASRMRSRFGERARQLARRSRPGRLLRDPHPGGRYPPCRRPCCSAIPAAAPAIFFRSACIPWGVPSAAVAGGEPAGALRNAIGGEARVRRRRQVRPRDPGRLPLPRRQGDDGRGGPAPPANGFLGGDRRGDASRCRGALRLFRRAGFRFRLGPPLPRRIRRRRFAHRRRDGRGSGRRDVIPPYRTIHHDQRRAAAAGTR